MRCMGMISGVFAKVMIFGEVPSDVLKLILLVFLVFLSSINSSVEAFC